MPLLDIVLCYPAIGKKTISKRVKTPGLALKTGNLKALQV